MTQIRKGNVTVTNGNPDKYVEFFKNEFSSHCDKLIVTRELKSKTSKLHYEIYAELKSDSCYNTKPRKGSELFRQALENHIGCKLVGSSNDYAFPIAKNPVNAMSYTLKDGDIVHYIGFTESDIEEKKKLWVKKEKASVNFVDSIVESHRLKMLSDPGLEPRDLWCDIVSRYQARGKPFGDHQLCSVFNICALKLYPTKFYRFTDDLFQKKYCNLL